MKPVDLLELFSARRSVKPAQFNGEIIEEETIALMLESARWAPTHALTQPWRFTVIEGEGIPRFTAFMQEAYKTHTPEEKFNVLKYEKLGNSLRACSHIILVGMKRQDIQKLPEWEEIAAVSAAVQNMQLVGHALGAVGYWSTGGVSTHPVMLDWLELGQEDRPLGMLLMGKTDVDVKIPERKTAEAFTIRIKA